MVITRSGLDTNVVVKTTNKTQVIYQEDGKTPVPATGLAALVADHIITASPSLFRNAIKTYGSRSRIVSYMEIKSWDFPQGLPSYGLCMDSWTQIIPLQNGLPIVLSIHTYIEPHPVYEGYCQFVLYTKIDTDDISGLDINNMEVTIQHWNKLQQFRDAIQDRFDQIWKAKNINDSFNRFRRLTHT
jgi:hypothetical protein